MQVQNQPPCHTTAAEPQTNIHNERVTHIGALKDGTGFTTVDESGIGRLYEGAPPASWPRDLRVSGAEDNH